MAKVILSPLAEEDIDQARRFTLERFGEAKDEEYKELIHLALRELEANPQAGKHRPDIFPYAWTLHIGRSGKRARHLFLYRIDLDDRVQIARLLYDGMDLPRHVPKDF
ncbi:MAG: type II toxin-antitoxin system RelE/ParE family toxin [Nannocystaceae bacterium]